jgi:hypothetical protein
LCLSKVIQKKIPTRLLCSKGEGEYYEEEMPRLLTKKRSIAEPFLKNRKFWSDLQVNEAMIEGVNRYKRWRNMVSTDVLISLRNRYDKSNTFDNVTNLTLN